MLRAWTSIDFLPRKQLNTLARESARMFLYLPLAKHSVSNWSSSSLHGLLALISCE